LVKISYLEITARSDYPHLGRPDLHLWEPTLQTLAKQTMKDFEYIVVDVFYEERKDYFKDHNYGLRIKHVPPVPSVWGGLGLCQTAHQFNTGLMYADGELIFMGADSGMYPPDLMANLWKHYQEGYFVSTGFGADMTYADESSEGLNAFGVLKGTFVKGGNIVPTDWYSFLGYRGDILMDHRYVQLFLDGTWTWTRITPQWYFGISSLSLKAALEVNGFDECFDGCTNLSDIDLGYRLDMLGHKLAMFKDCYTIEAYAGRDWHPKMRFPRPEIVCSYALLKRNILLSRSRVNTGDTEGLTDWLIRNVCNTVCEVKQTCREKCSYRAPFWNMSEPELFDLWKREAASYKVDLELERDMRLDGEYVEGTMVNV